MLAATVTFGGAVVAVGVVRLDSKAPMSGAPPCDRALPRSSVANPAGLLPLFAARLLFPTARVGLSPPLFARACRSRFAPNGRLSALAGDNTPGPGSTPMALFVAVTRPEIVFDEMSARAPVGLAVVLRATMVLWSST